MIKVRVLRFDEEKDKEPYFEEYELEKTNKMKVLDALIAINEKYNSNLSFRSSCRAGQCGSCAIKLNGNVVLACKATIENNAVIEPLDFPIIKDLIVDKSEIDKKIANMKLFLKADPNKSETNLKTDKNKSETNLKENMSYVEKTTNKKKIDPSNNSNSNEFKDKSENSQGDIQIKECGCPYIIENEECVDTKKVRSCIECYSCLSACPVIKVSDEFAGPYFMRYLSKFDFDPRDKSERTVESIDNGLYCCTSCGKCREVCPKEINSFGDAIEKLRALAYNKDLGPLEPHKELKERIALTGRSVEVEGESLIETLSKIKSKDNSKPKIGVFTGCMVDYRLQNVGFALMEVLKKNGFIVDVPEGQVCCGSPLLRTGQNDLVTDLVNKNKEVLSEYDIIITVCAGCGATLKKDYPKYGVNLNVKDISEFLADHLNTEDMKELDMKVTYHDPCHLKRGQGISQPPREILQKIKGVEFIEMEKPDQCCGAGGGVRSGKPQIAFDLGKKKVEMIKKLDVDAVLSICPFCQYNIQDALTKEGLENVKVMNILELLKMSYDNG
ncbi:lactate utilization protein A [Methanobrevibacter cuticularis]|uniref:Lactate utilization protein A n=1 Tax=Methanobrevibacter cuticularis TaxID=47311 RepID=A0A166EP16_9EURY|nr:fumarate reductase (CoM/CoB) subunit TfrB [Methanobrevibacter cuticularis]KZX16858.1 lactate utilization protein A [Methanobrevibacter cuticularis]